MAPPTFEVGEKKIKAILIFGKKEEKERSVGATFNAFSVSRPLLMVVPVVIFFRLQQQCFMEIFYRYILRSNLEGAFFSLSSCRASSHQVLIEAQCLWLTWQRIELQI